MERKRNINIPAIVHELVRYCAFYEETTGAYVGKNGIDINLSSAFTTMIKEAARCNRYSSDVIYDIQAINNRLETFNYNNENSYEPIVIAFRKDGVDGNGFILSRVSDASANAQYSIHFPKDYFSMFSLEFVKDDDYPGYVNIKIRGVHV